MHFLDKKRICVLIEISLMFDLLGLIDETGQVNTGSGHGLGPCWWQAIT